MPSHSDPIAQQILDEHSPNRNNARRRELIKSIEEKTGRKLLVYIAASHPVPIPEINAMRSIRVEDITFLEDLLRTADSEKGDLLINSAGGEPNVAEKMLMMCRHRFTKEFNVIVPNFAKSAATMIALGSDKILMGYLSELGPIDPQVIITDPSGKQQQLPAQAIVGGLTEIRRKIVEDKDPIEMYYPMLSQVRPEIIQYCNNAIKASQEFAEKWLKAHMLKSNPAKAEKVASELSNGVTYKSHGKVIDYAEAKDRLGLDVECIDPKSELWSWIWELYLRANFHLQMTNGIKLFESSTNSVAMNVLIQQVPIKQ